MTSVPVGADVFFEPLLLVSRQCPFKETFTYVIYGLGRRMAHILCIETVVSQLIHHYLIRREVVTSGMCDVIDGQHQGGLADLVPVRPVLEVSYGAYCEYEFLVGTHFFDLGQKECRLVRLQQHPFEFPGIAFQTVGYYDTLFYMPVAPTCTEGYDDLAAVLEEGNGILKARVGVFNEFLTVRAGK